MNITLNTRSVVDELLAISALRAVTHHSRSSVLHDVGTHRGASATPAPVSIASDTLSRDNIPGLLTLIRAAFVDVSMSLAPYLDDVTLPLDPEEMAAQDAGALAASKTSLAASAEHYARLTEHFTMTLSLRVPDQAAHLALTIKRHLEHAVVHAVLLRVDAPSETASDNPPLQAVLSLLLPSALRIPSTIW